MKKLLAVFLSLTLIVQLVVPAWADSTAAAADVTDSALVQTDVSGAEEKTQDAAASALSSGLTAEQLLLEDKVEGKLTRKLLFAAKENGYYTDVEEVISLLRSKMVERQTKVEIPLRVSTSEISEAELEALILGIFALAADHTGVADEGDYLLWQIGQIGYGAQYSVGGDYYYLDITYSLSYYTTQAQETQVANKLAAVIAGFGFTAETDDYTKVKTIYDYICENVVYDYEHLEDTSYTLKHSAYAALENGTSVCQGYALLLYRMLLMAGIDCRFISGYDAESGGAHAWNIVRLGNFYYNVDSTWDATIHQVGGEYQYFLKAPANFTDHVRDEVYTIPEFHQLHPMAAADYVSGEDTVIASGTCGDGVSWELGADGILTVSGSGAMDDYTSASNAPWYSYRNYVLGVVVEAGVKHVGNYAFYSYPYLQALSCAATTIGSYAFANNSTLLAVDLLEGVKEIGENAFAYTGLTTIVIPEGVTRLASCAFSNTSTLKELHLPASITQIEYQGVPVEEVHIADLAAWCSIEFPSAQANPLYNRAALYLNGQKVTHLVIPEGVTEIKDYAFPTYGGILKLTLPNSVVSVGKEAFCYSSITEVDWSENLETIGQQAFMGAKLKKLAFPDSLQKIGAEAFAHNWELAEVFFGAGALSIGVSAFYDCSALKELTLPDSVNTIEREAFSNCRELEKITIGSGLKTIPDRAFSYCTKLTDLIIGENIEQVGEDAFRNCSTLNSVVFPASLKELDRWVFRNCRNLDRIIFTGDAPKFDKNTLDGMREYNRVTTLVYPCTNSTWTEDLFQGYGHGSAQWIPDHNCENGVCTLCGAAEITLNGSCGDGVYWTLDAEGTLNIYGSGSILYNPLDRDPRLAASLVIGPGITGISGYKFSWKYENLKTITFTGNAPNIEDNAFHLLNATAYYPVNNPTWTKDVLKDYGGSITWVAACTAHTYENGVCTICGEKDPDFIPVGLKGDADNSGEVDYLDAMLVLQYHTGIVGDDMLNLTVCDVDGSGEVDYLDAMLLLQYHTGVIPEL